MSEGSGSRVRVRPGGARAVVHRPHPQKETDRGAGTRMMRNGYVGDVEYDADADVFHGEVVHTRDVLTFQGSSVEELEQAFRGSVEDFLSWCAEEGVAPEKPYSGRFNLRLSPDLHREVAIAAKRSNTSINAFVEKAIEDELRTSKR